MKQTQAKKQNYALPIAIMFALLLAVSSKK